MAGLKQRYIAQAGITFDARKLRVEAGEELPANIAQADIDDLLAQAAIKLSTPDVLESEGAA
jgi:hypothetical protein